jgi:hypothetical protein
MGIELSDKTFGISNASAARARPNRARDKNTDLQDDDPIVRDDNRFGGTGKPPQDPLSLVKDPLSDVTRKERRTLLGVSALGIIMVKAGLVPQKISTLGIDFQEIDKSLLLKSIAAVVAYFLVAFLIYALSDFIAWRIAYRKAVRDLIKTSSKDMKDIDAAVEETLANLDKIQGLGWEQRFLSFSTGPVSILRSLFEFVVPLIIAIYAIVSLLRASIP